MHVYTYFTRIVLYLTNNAACTTNTIYLFFLRLGIINYGSPYALHHQRLKLPRESTRSSVIIMSFSHHCLFLVGCFYITRDSITHCTLLWSHISEWGHDMLTLDELAQDFKKCHMWHFISFTEAKTFLLWSRFSNWLEALFFSLKRFMLWTNSLHVWMKRMNMISLLHIMQINVLKANYEVCKLIISSYTCMKTWSNCKKYSIF